MLSIALGTAAESSCTALEHSTESCGREAVCVCVCMGGGGRVPVRGERIQAILASLQSHIQGWLV